MEYVYHLLITGCDRAERVEMCIQEFLENTAIGYVRSHALILREKDHCFSLLVILGGSGILHE